MHAIKMKQYGVLRLLESVQPSGDDEQVSILFLQVILMLFLLY
jgi:hypothetical protein